MNGPVAASRGKRGGGERSEQLTPAVRSAITTHNGDNDETTKTPRNTKGMLITAHNGHNGDLAAKPSFAEATEALRSLGGGGAQRTPRKTVFQREKEKTPFLF